jgi:predicted lipoprotein with Yx(FWY)xxD motif
MLSTTTTFAVLLLVALFGLGCAGQGLGQGLPPNGDSMKLAKAFLDTNAANAAAAAQLLAKMQDASISVADKQVAVQVGVQQVRLPLIKEFQAAAGASDLAVTTKPQQQSVNGTTGPACVQKTMDATLQELAKFPWNQTLSFYKDYCNAHPTDAIGCFEKLREHKYADYQALKSAKENNVTLSMACVPTTKHGDYDVGDPFNITESGIPRQLEGALKLKKIQDLLAKLTATTTQETTAETTTASTAPTTTAATQPGDTTAATTTTRTTTRTTAAPTTTASAKPTIRRVGNLLQVPAGTPTAGRTIYFLPSETSTSQQCTGGCANVWIPLNGEKVAEWALDPAAACAGSAGNTLGAVPSASSQSGLQLTCGNRLLYMFVEDSQPGDNKGLQFNGLPFVNA